MLNKAVLKNTLRQKATWLLFAFGLFPLLTVITELLGSDLMRIKGEVASVSCLGLISALFDTMNRIIVPAIIMAFISAGLFNDEIQTGRLSFFKDQDRKKVMNAKIRSLVIVYAMYFVILTVSTIISYYALHAMGNMPILSGAFVGDRKETIGYLLEISGVVANSFAVLAITIAISVKASTGYTILAAILINLLTQLAGLAKELTYIVPSGYLTVLADSATWIQLAVVALIAVAYIALGYTLTNKSYSKVEY